MPSKLFFFRSCRFGDLSLERQEQESVLLLRALAQVCDMQVGELVHVIADAHIYDRHIPIIKELIGREQHPAPKFTLNPEIKDFYQFTTKDITIEDYVTGPQIKNIPIAV